MFDVVPSLNTLFAAWYTYEPDGQQIGGGASQRWYTLQAPLASNGSAPSALTLENVPIYTATGGVFDNPAKTTNSQVGTATVAFSHCGTLTVTYNFTGGSNSGQSGKTNLQPLGPMSAGCNF
jgi:hypothetical protein